MTLPLPSSSLSKVALMRPEVKQVEHTPPICYISTYEFQYTTISPTKTTTLQLPSVFYQPGWNEDSVSHPFRKYMDEKRRFDRFSLMDTFNKIPYVTKQSHMETIIDKFNRVTKNEIIADDTGCVRYQADYQKTICQVCLH
jgi:hypothetical protein